MPIDPLDRRALVLASVATGFLIAAIVLPMRWAFVLLVCTGIAVGAVAVASSIRRLPNRRA